MAPPTTPRARNRWWPKVRNFLAGYSSGVCLVLAGHPFDTIKVRLQNEGTKVGRFSGLGDCLHTIASCVDGASQTCDPFEGSSVEACDGADNDCDGVVDEDQPMLSCGVGACVHTSPSCADGVPLACDPLQGAAPEICDGVDNDCDGDLDEDQPPLTCGLGVCASRGRL